MRSNALRGFYFVLPFALSMTASGKNPAACPAGLYLQAKPPAIVNVLHALGMSRASDVFDSIAHSEDAALGLESVMTPAYRLFLSVLFFVVGCAYLFLEKRYRRTSEIKA